MVNQVVTRWLPNGHQVVTNGHQVVTKWPPCCHYILFTMVVMVVLVMMPLLHCRARGYIRTMNGRQGPTSHVANQRTKDVGG